MNSFDEKELLCRLADGDQEALTSIYEQYWQPLFISAFNIIRDKNACEDIIQEIFLHLWLKRESLQIRESLKSYLHAATRYQVFRHIRNMPAKQELFEQLEEKMTTSPTEQALQLKDLHRTINKVVNDLPDKCQQIYRLSREEYLSHKEIAERLGISTKTVENQLTIALRRLRISLQEWSFLLIFILLGL